MSVEDQCIQEFEALGYSVEDFGVLLFHAFSGDPVSLNRIQKLKAGQEYLAKLVQEGKVCLYRTKPAKGYHTRTA